MKNVNGVRRPFDYLNDRYAVACLEQAENGRSDVCFGSVLVKHDRILGRGWNRRATQEDRNRLTHVDYAIHAEQAAILDAIDRGHNPTGGTIYVLGFARTGPNKGQLTTRTQKIFVCRKCPHTLKRYNVNVCIPHIRGWSMLTPEQAARTGEQYSKDGYWKRFVKE